MDRVNVLLLREISGILARELNDPRLSPLISIMRVDTSTDLRYAKIFVSVFGDRNDKESALAALNSASGFVHRILKKNLTLRAIPFLTFHLDESIEQGTEMLKMIDEAVSQIQDIE